MKINFKNKKGLMSGFTLIELMVVMAIISLLSSIVFTTLSNSRSKAKDAAIKQGVDQLVTLMNLEYNDTGSYCNLQSTWINSGSGLNSCDSENAFKIPSNYAIQARAICANIFNNAKEVGWGDPGAYKILAAVDSLYSCNNAYAFTVYLNNDHWYCASSSGKKEESTTWQTCHDNP